MSVPVIVRETVAPNRTTAIATCPQGRWGTVMITIVNHSHDFGPTVQPYIGGTLTNATMLYKRKLDVDGAPGDNFTLGGAMTEGESVFVVTDSPVNVVVTLITELIV